MKLPPVVPSEANFSSRLRSAAVAARVGVWVGVCFAIAFVTGLISHYAQAGTQDLGFPASPAWGYQLSQTLHVVAGTAAIPLLLMKLWVVYPKLFQAPPRKLGEALIALFERGSIAVLVAGSILELGIGVMNVAQWYIWPFDFKRTHYALAWVVIGALLVHIAVKLPVIRSALTADIEDTSLDRPTATKAGAVSRRTLVRTSWLAAAIAVVAGSPAAGTAPFLNKIAVLAARSRRSGIPINRTASQVGVVAAATSPHYACDLVYGGTAMTFTREELLALPQATHVLPIACVEGWSADGTWTGVPFRTLLDVIGAPRGRAVRVTSLQVGSYDGVTQLPANFVDDERTLLALMLDGQPLSLDHGYPARLIAPDRPGALQTKWVGRIEVLA